MALYPERGRDYITRLASLYDNCGILTMSIYDFLLNPSRQPGTLVSSSARVFCAIFGFSFPIMQPRSNRFDNVVF